MDDTPVEWVLDLTGIDVVPLLDAPLADPWEAPAGWRFISGGWP